MRKSVRIVWLAALVCAVLLHGRPAAASPWTLTGGVTSQSGQRTFAAIDCDFTWHFGVDAAPVRYSLAAAGEHLALSGFYEMSETAGATVDPDFAADHAKYRGEPYGRSKAWGADISARWSGDLVEVEPLVGYRYTCFTAGARQTAADPRDQRTHTYAFGLEPQGARVGLKATLKPTDRLRLAVALGWMPCPTVAEVREELAEGNAADGSAETVGRRWPSDQVSRMGDAGWQVEYQVTPEASGFAGYSKEWGRFRFYPGVAAPGAGCLGELYHYGGEWWRAGFTVRF